MLFSLIIPIYNTEQYIERCLHSVVKELLDECEVILVDDGSPDHSVEIIQNHYAQLIETGQFRLIHTKNAGVAAARNVGVAHATGAYVGFLDSDDVLLDGYFEILNAALSDGSFDIVQFHMRRFGTSKPTANSPVVRTHPKAGSYDLAQVRNSIFGFNQWYLWARVYRREVLARQTFPEGEVYEDLTTVPMIYLNDLKVLLLDDCLIGYRVNYSGITSNHTREHAKTLLAFFFRVAGMKQTAATGILQVTVARSLSYFRAELGLSDEIPANLIAKKLDVFRADSKVKRNLKLPDLIFLHQPRLYFWLDRLRLSYLPRSRH